MPAQAGLCQLWGPRTCGSSKVPGSAFSTVALSGSLTRKETLMGSVTSLRDGAVSSTCLVPYFASDLEPNYNLFYSQTVLFNFADIRKAAYGVKYFLGG